MSEKPAQEAIRKGGIRLRTKVNGWAVLVAAVTSQIASAVYYIVLGDAWLTLRGIDPGTTEMTPPVWQMAGQFTRNLVVAFVLAHLLSRLAVTTPTGALRVGLLVWFGFEAMAVVGSVLHENYPLGLYGIHVGDALMATLIMALILGGWRRDAQPEVQPGSTTFTSPTALARRHRGERSAS